MGLLHAMGMGGLGCDPAPRCLIFPSLLCFPMAADPTNLSLPSALILNPLHLGKNPAHPASSLAGICSDAAGGCIASGFFFPTKSTIECS